MFFYPGHKADSCLSFITFLPISNKKRQYAYSFCFIRCLLLFMMIRLIIQNSHCPIKLFHKHQPNHLVRKSHFG